MIAEVQVENSARVTLTVARLPTKFSITDKTAYYTHRTKAGVGLGSLARNNPVLNGHAPGVGEPG